jgi:hypothetical protein
MFEMACSTSAPIEAHSTCFTYQDVTKILPYSEVLADNKAYHALYFFNIVTTGQNASYFNQFQ